MLDEKLKIRGTAIVRELEMGVEQTTEKWMAHYLAELIELTEMAETSELREQAAKQSAEIILTLWEQKKNQVRHEYYSALNRVFNEVYEKRSFAETLKSVLDDTDQLDAIKEFADQIGILFCLDFYETDLLRLCLIVDIISKMKKDEMIEEVVEEFEDMFISTRNHLQDIWPNMAQFSLMSVTQLQSFTTSKLRDFHQLRSRLLAKLGEINDSSY